MIPTKWVDRCRRSNVFAGGMDSKRANSSALKRGSRTCHNELVTCELNSRHIPKLKEPVHVNECACKWACAHVGTHACTHIHTFTHKHTYTHTQQPCNTLKQFCCSRWLTSQTNLCHYLTTEKKPVWNLFLALTWLNHKL